MHRLYIFRFEYGRGLRCGFSKINAFRSALIEAFAKPPF